MSKFPKPKTPLTYEPDSKIIYDADGKVFLYSGALGTAGLVKNDELDEFHHERAEYIVRILNDAAPKPKYYRESEDVKESWIENKERGVRTYDAPADGSSWIEDWERRKK